MIVFKVEVTDDEVANLYHIVPEPEYDDWDAMTKEDQELTMIESWENM